MDVESSFTQRAVVHRALGDVHRLAIVDLLWHSDCTASQLSEQTGLASNLLAFHLGVLEQAGLVSRHASQGDRRRRYLKLTPAAVPHVGPVAPLAAGSVLFVCTHNAARSQLAAALWHARTHRPAASAGTKPAGRVHPHAVAVAAAHDLDLSHARPTHVDDITTTPDLVVSVCDRANEAGIDLGAPRRHWSIPDPDGGDRAAFASAFDTIANRVDRLAAQTAATRAHHEPIRSMSHSWPNASPAIGSAPPPRPKEPS